MTQVISPASERKVVCVDMDEVIADALSEHLLRYNSEFNENLCLSDLHGKWIWDHVPPERLARLEDYIRSADFFSNLAVMPEAQRVLERMQERYEVFVATAAMEVPTSFTAKFEWMRLNFPFIRPSHLVFCGNKGILRGDYLIDDNPRQLRRFHGEGILFSAPANAFITGFRRVDHWLDVERMFLD